MAKETPTSLNPRFEIRRLEPAHLDWAKAIIMHTNTFHSPVWPILYPENKARRLYDGFAGADYLIQHQIESGMSFGVFDKEYVFRYPESEKTGGALHWDMTDETATGEQLLHQMDFPLVSIAVAYDAAHPLDESKLTSLLAALPAYGEVMHQLDVLDIRKKTENDTTTDTKPETDATTTRKLMRNGTSTRADYEGFKLMKTTAHLLMRHAAGEGYNVIEIPTLHNAVHHVWANPPAPFKSTVVAEFNFKDLEREEGGVVVKPYAHINQVASKIIVSLAT
ncbi:hypothetical protein ASPZODRAFT_218295 [Penicilliopsis zonata CBS 506.65]|uniref:N-acetyltransferase domain-containing protein n=1 Tax=Penicilliopsis zonata CBS 506.65 TaxID=1073090 RepID=A0A1L9SU57_9EURO|nr:hypothetical protein ASPZODRAFT_218295 [Penicilliopsis zonata CBS 506.65]OJJ50603.1 hypothetical protein ASPZODRAFT_218295 [Penicilliopsis zonata CBS 506.65]